MTIDARLDVLHLRVVPFSGADLIDSLRARKKFG